MSISLLMMLLIKTILTNIVNVKDRNNINSDHGTGIGTGAGTGAGTGTRNENVNETRTIIGTESISGLGYRFGGSSETIEDRIGNESYIQNNINFKDHEENNLITSDIEVYPNSNLYPSYIRNYEYLISTSARNNKITCVEKEYDDLIYYTHNINCDPQNTFSFSFNSTFKFDKDFFDSYEQSKKYFKEIPMTPDYAVGSCISCFFLDEMNLLSIYGYTFVYKHTDETELKNEYERIIDTNISNEKRKKALMLEGSTNNEVIAVRENILQKNSERHNNADTDTVTAADIDTVTAADIDTVTAADIDTVTAADIDTVTNTNAETDTNTDTDTDIDTDSNNIQSNSQCDLHCNIEGENTTNILDQKEISVYKQKMSKHKFHSHEDNMTLLEFLKKNQINYTYDEIGKGTDSFTHTAETTDIQKKNVQKNMELMGTTQGTKNYDDINTRNKLLQINMLDDFFMFLKKKDQMNLKKLKTHKKTYTLKILDNMSINSTQCTYLKKHLESQKIWSNVIFINSFKNAKILSHVHKYKGKYSDFKKTDNENVFRTIKINEFIRETLDLHNSDYLLHNHVFFVIANEEIKFIHEIQFCPDIFSEDPSTAYIKNPQLMKNYEKLRTEYMSEDVYHQVFLTIALYINNEVQLFLLDEIKGNNYPLMLSIPFLFLVTHSYFAQFNNIFIKDNMFGWVDRNKSLYAKSTRDILLTLEGASHFSKKKFNVLTVENKLISNIYILNLCHDTFEYVMFVRFNPLSDFGSYRRIGFEAVLLYVASSFTEEELKTIEIFFEKLINKEKTNLTKREKKKRMDIYEIYVVPSDNYEKFHILLAYLFKAIFDCGGRHISKLLKIALLRSHHDMLYNLNCYNYRLYSLLRNIKDISSSFYEYSPVNSLFKESWKILLQLVDLTMKEMDNLIPFNKNKKYMIKYFIVILYYFNEVYCSDRENAIYLQIIYEYREFNVSHAIILSYLSQNKVGTLCSWNDAPENDTLLPLDIISNFSYTTHEDTNIYLKHNCNASNVHDLNYSECFLKKFDHKYFGDLQIGVKSQEILTIALYIVSYTSTVNFFIGELDRTMQKINIHRLFKNVLVQNFNFNITKYFTYWNSKIYVFDQYEPECVILFNRYHLYEKNYHGNESKAVDAATQKEGSNSNRNVHGDSDRDDTNGMESDQWKKGNVTNKPKENLNEDESSVNTRIYHNKQLMAFFAQKSQTCVVHEKVGKRHSSDFVVNEYLQLRYNFINRLKKNKNDLYKRMVSYNFFNDPLDISKKTSDFKEDNMVNTCKNIEVHKNRLCLLHKSKSVLVYLYIMAALPELTYFVVTPLIFIKPYKYCDEYDIPLILNSMLKYKNFYKKNAKICINYAFAHFISSRDKTSALNLTAKIRGTMVTVSRRNLLLIMPLIKRVNVLSHITHTEYNIKEEIVSEYFIWGNPHTPVEVKAYEFFKYDSYKKIGNPTIAGAFVSQFDSKHIIYQEITRQYDEDKKCTKHHLYDVDGKPVCFCGILDHKFENKCTYPYCDESQEFCAQNEKCINGKCECVSGYSRNPMSSLCEQNNECILSHGSTCESPASCVFLNNRFVCLCPFPYIRILNTCLHPDKGIKLGLRIFNNFTYTGGHDEECAAKKERFYINVFGTLSEYLTAAFNYIIEPDLKSRIYMPPVKKEANGLNVTVFISRNTDPTEPTSVEVLRNFLHQLNDANSALNNGFFAYFARFTYVDYVVSFPETDGSSTFNLFERFLPNFILNLFQMSIFSNMTPLAAFNFTVLVFATVLMAGVILHIFVKAKFFKNDKVHTF